MQTWFNFDFKGLQFESSDPGTSSLAILIQIRLNPAVEHKIDQASAYFEIHLAQSNSYFEIIYTCSFNNLGNKI